MKKFKCKICEKSFNSYDSLRKHTGRIHKIPSEQFFIDFYSILFTTCKCGCGEKTSLDRKNFKFKDYRRGHIARVKNNWGHNPKAIANSAKTRRERHIEPWNKGKKGLQVAWNKGLTKEDNSIMAQMAKNLSKIKKKDKKNTARLAKISKEYWSKQENRDSQRDRRMEYMKNYRFPEETKSIIEIWFQENILDKHNIKYEEQYMVKEIKSFFDFYLLDHNILVEVDGDFWHCNQELGFKPTYNSQKRNIKKDKIKNEWCKNNRIKLLRFWENDINNNPEKVKNKLLLYL